MSLLTFLAFLGACMAAATTGAMFGPGQWYDKLDKPSWTPPNWLFPLAWTVLYIAIAVAAWRVAVSGANTQIVTLGLALWSLQIALNTLWTPVFFGLQRIFGGLLVLGSLWLAVLLTTAGFLTVDWLAGLLFAFYLLWVSFAGALNYNIWRRNRKEAEAVTEHGGV
ncbi:MAG: tryptophan-rich sensory protein TspO [Halorhodospira sp.]